LHAAGGRGGERSGRGLIPPAPFSDAEKGERAAPHRLAAHPSPHRRGVSRRRRDGVRPLGVAGRRDEEVLDGSC
jgi:hypothetical protein